MRIKGPLEAGAWALRERAWSVDDRVRDRAVDAAEAVQDAEERVLWRGTYAARLARRRAAGSLAPLQRLVQTKLTWPIADAYRSGGATARTALASAAVVALLGAAAADVLLAPDGDPDAAPQPLAQAEQLGLAAAAGPSGTLRGVAPDFDAGESASGGSTVAARRVPSAPAVAEADLAKAPPTEVAYRFAQAFVQYEIGEVDAKTAATFAAVADKPLAESLATEPPRLPAGAEVPKAEVLNVVLADREGDEVEASISLARLKAASELRLTLRRTPEGWQVVEVLG